MKWFTDFMDDLRDKVIGKYVGAVVRKALDALSYYLLFVTPYLKLTGVTPEQAQNFIDAWIAAINASVPIAVGAAGLALSFFWTFIQKAKTSPKGK